MWGCALDPSEGSVLIATFPHKEEKKTEENVIVLHWTIPVSSLVCTIFLLFHLGIYAENSVGAVCCFSYRS